MLKFDDIKVIEENYNNGKYTFTKAMPKRVDIHYIFDENKTVKWNREQRIKHNDSIGELIEQWNEERKVVESKLHSDVVDFIVNCYGLTEAQAKLIESEVYADKHSCMSDYFYSVDKFAELVKDIIALGKN